VVCFLLFFSFSFYFFIFFYFFLFLLLTQFQISISKMIFTRSCSFHPNVIKLIGYTIEPERYIVTKKYELDLFHFIYHPNEELPPLLAMKLTKYPFTFFFFSFCFFFFSYIQNKINKNLFFFLVQKVILHQEWHQFKNLELFIMI